jgi:4'-phosphopantetheinyl transferase
MKHITRDGEAHVWVVPTDALLPDTAMPAAWLTPVERRRCAAIAEPEASRVFALTRIALRGILAGITGVAPAELELVIETGGRPVLVGGGGWRFSVSHSRDIAVIAVACADVGVDVEHARRLRHPSRTARRILHPETVARLEALPEARRASAFLDAWTQREAHVKAVGGGLFRTPDSLPFTPGGQIDGVLGRIRDRVSGEIWNVAHFAPGDRTRGALVVRGDASAMLLHDRAATLQRIAEVRS